MKVARDAVSAVQISRVASLTATELGCRLATTFASTGQFPADWDYAVTRSNGSIYMTYDWLRIWWQFHGTGKGLRLFLFSFGDEPVAALPIYLESFFAGPMRIIVARIVGANIPPKTFNPPVDPAHARPVFAGVLRHLFEKEGCDLVSFGPVSTAWPAYPAWCELMESGELRDVLSRAHVSQRDVQTWFELPPSFEDYLASLGSGERKSRLKRLRNLEKQYAVTSDVVSDPALVESEFEAFSQQHSRQWQAVGKGGHFAAWPNAHAYNLAQVKAQAAHGRVRFFRMLVNGQVVANRYTFLLGNTLFSELPAREVGEPWDKLGVGTISLLKFNEDLIRAGIGFVDSGLGQYEHKTGLGGQPIPVMTWRLSGRGMSRFKAGLFRGVSRGMLTVCHKLWYKRLLPRMPRNFKRTQSIRWLRFDA